MYLRCVLVWLRRITIVFAVVSTTYLYLYPVVYGCAFSSTTGSTYDGFKNTIEQHWGHLSNSVDAIAPFRLLVLADPQLEGDSSLPDPEDALLARVRVHWRRLAQTSQDGLKDALVGVMEELVMEDIPRAFWAARKTLDLFGNDYYLAHIYRTLHWWTMPSHVTVLGDLIGSQWVSDDEFAWRGWRYWNRVFAGSHKVDEEIMNVHEQDEDNQRKFPLGKELPEDWSKKVINIAGNHDIGYAGDISQSRIDRFECIFGKANWDIKFTYPLERIPEAFDTIDPPMPAPEIHLIILNSMLLDTPVLDQTLQGQTYSYINNLITARLSPVESRNTIFTLLLTHVPLHKPEGICVDAPFFDFWDFSDADGTFKHGGLKEQNHLSEHTSKNGILRAIYGMSGDPDMPVGGKGRNGLILNGHDHEGCDVVHYVERTTSQNPPADENGQQAQTDEQETQMGESPPSTNDGTQHEQISSWTWKSIRHHDFASLQTHLSPPQAETELETGSRIATSLREITLRSMMGSYSGNAGLLSLWYDFDAGNWDYRITMCPAGVQHTWWAIHVLDVVAVMLVMAQVLGWFYKRVVSSTGSGDNKVRGVRKAGPAEKRVGSNGSEKHEARSATRRRRKG